MMKRATLCSLLFYISLSRSNRSFVEYSTELDELVVQACSGRGVHINSTLQCIALVSADVNISMDDVTTMQERFVLEGIKFGGRFRWIRFFYVCISLYIHMFVVAHY